MSPEEWVGAQRLWEEDPDFLMQGVNAPVVQMSPHTVCTTLEAYPNISRPILWGIAQGLCETLETQLEVEKEREAVRIGTELALHERIEELEGWLDVAQQESQQFAAPPGYSVNNDKYPNLFIHADDSSLRIAHWIKELEDSHILGYYLGQPTCEDPWVFEVYAQPWRAQEGQRVTALPTWFRHLLLGPPMGYTLLCGTAQAVGHPGLYAEVVRMCNLSNALSGAKAKLNTLEGDILSIQCDMGLCEGHLVQAQAHHHVSHLKNAGNNVTRHSFGSPRHRFGHCGDLS
jgi:hypothetical protein